MKRMLLTAAISAMFIAAAPGLALAAPHATHHHRARHSSRHARHAARARVLSFTASGVSTSSGSGTSTAPSGSSTSPAGTPSTGETVGTVTSFTAGVLTITLNDGSTVSGKVTEQTEIHCRVATPPGGSGQDGEGEDSGSQGEDGGGPAEEGQPAMTHRDAMSTGGGEDGGDGGGDQSGSSSSCSSEALVPGAVVAEAELSIEGSGAVWDHLTLVH